MMMVMKKNDDMSVLEAINFVKRNVKTRANMHASNYIIWIINKYINGQVYTSLLTALSVSLSVTVCMHARDLC